MGGREQGFIDIFGRCWFNGNCEDPDEETPCSSDSDNCEYNRKVRNNWYCIHANTNACDTVKSNIHNRGLTEKKADRDLVKSNIHNRGLTEKKADRDLDLLESMGVALGREQGFIDIFGRCWFNGNCEDPDEETPCSSDADNCQYNRKVRNNW